MPTRSGGGAPAPITPSLRAWLDRGVGAAVAAGRAGRLGQHQLRRAGLHRLPDLPGQLVAGDELSRRASSCGASWARPAPASTSAFAALTAIHYAHRLVAYACVRGAGVGWPGNCGRLARCAGRRRWIAGLALLQLATGLSNVVLGWPLAGGGRAHRRRRGAGGGADLGAGAKAARAAAPATLSARERRMSAPSRSVVRA